MFISDVSFVCSFNVCKKDFATATKPIEYLGTIKIKIITKHMVYFTVTSVYHH